MFVTSRSMNGSLCVRNSIYPYTPSVSVTDSRATSQESDLFSYSSSVTADKSNAIRSRPSPIRSSRCLSVVSLSGTKYPLSLYRKSKTFKKLSCENLSINGSDSISSSQLSIKISEFLQRTDHVTNEWKKIGKENKKKQFNDLDQKIDLYFESVKPAPLLLEYDEHDREKLEATATQKSTLDKVKEFSILLLRIVE